MRAFRVPFGAGALVAGALVFTASCGSDDPSVAIEDAGSDATAPTNKDGGATADSATADSATDHATPDAPPAPYGLDVRPSNTTCIAPKFTRNVPSVGFETIFGDAFLTSWPTALAEDPVTPNRWFVSAREKGTLLAIRNEPNAAGTVVADLAALSGLPIQITGETGFLGFALHPKFAENGRIYVFWTTSDGLPSVLVRSRIGVITSPDHGATFTKYETVYTLESTTAHHKGGGIVFGPDGYLYVSYGDSGFSYEAQNPKGFLGRLLRIDVDHTSPGLGYAIPPDNPYANDPAFEPATFARGFRNPFRFSFDRATGDLWAGDVGESTWEEVDRVRPAGNYGWPCREGFADFWGLEPTYCPGGTKNVIDPISVLAHTVELAPYRSIIGGVVYRGSAIPDLAGAYLYGDYTRSELYSVTFDPRTAVAETRSIAAPSPFYPVHFTEDASGEVYAVSLYGKIVKMVPAASPGPPPLPERLSQTGCFDAADPKKPAPGVIPYDVNVPEWRDGASAERFLALPDGTALQVDASGHLVVPPGGMLLKTFSSGKKPIETEVLARHDDGTWTGYSYEWNADGTDAVLLPWSKRKSLAPTGTGAPAWLYPTRADCVTCHTEAAGRSLGLDLAQLERDVVYPSTGRTSNQRATLEHVGVLERAADAGTVTPLPAVNGAGSLESRARGWLHVSCSNCHRPGGARGEIDLRAQTPLAATKTCNVPGARGDLGIAGGALLVPGAPGKSLLSVRAHKRDADGMPLIGPIGIDSEGLAVVDQWIAALAACP